MESIMITTLEQDKARQNRIRVACGFNANAYNANLSDREMAMLSNDSFAMVGCFPTLTQLEINEAIGLGQPTDDDEALSDWIRDTLEFDS